MDKNRAVTLPLAMKDFFYREKVDTLTTFMAEMKALTNEDKADFREMLLAEGYKFQPTT